jgi:hypothetical protein
MHRGLVLALAGLAFAAVGFAVAPAVAQRAAGVTVATVATPFAEAARIITGSIVWNCEGDTCQTGSTQTANVRACRQLAREAGTLTAYAAGDVVFTSSQLESCNSAARPRS